MKKHIPNTVTLLNLFSGCCATVAVLNSQFILASWFLLISVLADYLDGAVARMLDVKSPLGKELDSMADMVSFGIVPGVILYMLLLKGMDMPGGRLVWKAVPAFLLSTFAGLRLAKFNLDTRQEDHFLGLPTPSCTLFVVGLMLIYQFDSYSLQGWVTSPAFIYVCVIVLSFLLVSEIPMFHFKFKVLTWKGNELKLSFAIISIISLFILKEAALSLIVFVYILVNLGQLLIRRNVTQ